MSARQTSIFLHQKWTADGQRSCFVDHLQLLFQQPVIKWNVTSVRIHSKPLLCTVHTINGGRTHGLLFLIACRHHIPLLRNRAVVNIEDAKVIWAGKWAQTALLVVHTVEPIATCNCARTSPGDLPLKLSCSIQLDPSLTCTSTHKRLSVYRVHVRNWTSAEDCNVSDVMRFVQEVICFKL